VVSKFKTWDKNSNGSISKSEFKEMVPRVVNLLHKTPTEFLKTLKPKDIDDLFDFLDADFSNSITLTEFKETLIRKKKAAPAQTVVAAPAAAQKAAPAATKTAVAEGAPAAPAAAAKNIHVQRHEALKAKFREMDTDGSGKISKRELYNTLAKTDLSNGSHALQLFQEADANADGQLNFEEFERISKEVEKLQREAENDAESLAPGAVARSGQAAEQAAPAVAAHRMPHAPSSSFLAAAARDAAPATASTPDSSISAPPLRRSPDHRPRSPLETIMHRMSREDQDPSPGLEGFSEWGGNRVQTGGSPDSRGGLGRQAG